MDTEYRSSPFRTHRLDGNVGRAKARKQIMRAMSFFGVLVVVFGGAGSLVTLPAEQRWSILLPPFSIFVLVLSGLTIVGFRQAGGQLGHFSIELSENVIRRIAGRTRMELSQGEVLRIIEVARRGLRLYGPDRSLFIPCEIDGYTEIRATLAGWMHIEEMPSFAVPAEQATAWRTQRMRVLILWVALVLICLLTWRVMGSIQAAR